MHLGSAERKDGGKKSGVERGEGEEQRQPVQPGKIAAGDDEKLENDGNHSGDTSDRLGQEIEEWDDQLREMVEEHAAFVEPLRGVVKIPTDRVRHRLSFVVIVQAGKIAPA